MGLLGRFRRRKVPRIKVSQYRTKLAKGNIPSNEISSILRNLEKLEKAGMSQRDINTVVNNIVKVENFKLSFLKDQTLLDNRNDLLAARITKTQ